VTLPLVILQLLRRHASESSPKANAGKVCRCGAQNRNCHQRISAAALTAVRACYWSLSLELRGHLLRSLYEAAQAEQQGSLDLDLAASSSSSGPESDVPVYRRQRPHCPPVTWQLCGHRVCFANFAHLLGTTERSIRKSIHSEPDHRHLKQQREPSGQVQIVEFFFL
jgi:hypothetical protein